MSPAADAWARSAARKLLSNRAGHGGDKSHGVGYRVMREADLIAVAGIAFDAGRAEADSELAAMLAKLRLIFAQRRKFSDPELRALGDSLAVLNGYNARRAK